MFQALDWTPGDIGMNKPNKNPCPGEADIIVVGWSCRPECLPSPSVLLLLLEKMSGLAFYFYNGMVASVSELELETVLENNFGHDLDLAPMGLSPEESGDLLPLDP